MGSLSFLKTLSKWEHPKTHGQGQYWPFGDGGVGWGNYSGWEENGGYGEEDDLGNSYGDGDGTGVKSS